MPSQPRHRPKRQFPTAERKIIECDLDTCVRCGKPLRPRKPWHMHKTVQTLQGVRVKVLRSWLWRQNRIKWGQTPSSGGFHAYRGFRRPLA